MDTYHRILQSGERLFTAQGYERTTMDQIAREIGLSKGALYYFFKNKSELFCQIVDTGLEELEHYTFTCLQSSQSGDLIALQVLQKFVDMAYDNSGIVLMILGGQVFGDASPVSDMLRPRLSRLQKTVEQIIAVGISEGLVVNLDIRTAAKALLGMIYGIIALPDVPAREQAVSGICDLLIRGLWQPGGASS